ncbi:MAG: acyltransferase [Actinomycetota bacterium]|nr:acyltransferase [Actinomycetota bacterium]
MRTEDPRLTELRSLGARIGTSIYLGPEVYFEKDFATLLTIEDDVVLSQGVTVLLHDSSLNNLLGAPIKFGAVTLRRGCYVGADVTVMCGVEIGAGALIGAKSLVRTDVAEGAVAYGSPAREVGTVADLAARDALEEQQLVTPGSTFFHVPAPRWKDRTLDEDRQLGADIEAAMQRWSGGDTQHDPGSSSEDPNG